VILVDAIAVSSISMAWLMDEWWTGLFAAEIILFVPSSNMPEE
jgi:hypothetical protein